MTSFGRLFVGLLALLVMSCPASRTQVSGESTFEVTDFHQGKMRESSSGWEVYEEGEELNYEVNGNCVYSGKSHPCMWHGFILHYQTNQPQVVLDCVVVSDTASNYGNPNEVIAENAQSLEFELPLDGNETVFVNPQYVIGYGIPGQPQRSESLCTCTFGGEEVLRFRQVLTSGS